MFIKFLLGLLVTSSIIAAGAAGAKMIRGNSAIQDNGAVSVASKDVVQDPTVVSTPISTQVKNGTQVQAQTNFSVRGTNADDDAAQTEKESEIDD